MSLSHDDLQAIRTFVEEAVSPLRDDIEALSNDIKDIYDSIEKKIPRLHAELVEAARQAGVSLPSH